MIKVALLKCHEYSHELLRQKISEGLKGIGFDMKNFSKKRVALKPNLLLPAPIEKAVVTHPAFVGAVASLVREYGGVPVLVESPAMTSLESTLKKVGYIEMIEKQGIEVANVTDSRILFYDSPLKFKRFEISKDLFNADIIINLPKLKTHGITYITGAVKNLFGVIPGLNKSKWHMKAPTPSDFSGFLLDLNEALVNGFDKPKVFLHIMDAIIGQEGEGPGPSGTPKKIGGIIIGQNPVAVDYVAASVLGIDINKVQTVANGFKRDLGVASPGEIEVIGERIGDLKISDFIPTRHTFLTNLGVRWPFNSKGFRNLLTERPLPVAERCTLCYKCKKICPAGAIEKAADNEKTPHYDYQKCIRCYCCKEICSYSAIDLKKGRLQWIMGG